MLGERESLQNYAHSRKGHTVINFCNGDLKLQNSNTTDIELSIFTRQRDFPLEYYYVSSLKTLSKHFGYLHPIYES